MSTIGFKKYSVVKIYFLFIRNIYSEANEKFLKNFSLAGKIIISIYFFIHIIFYSPKLLKKFYKDRNKINRALENQYIENLLELLFNIKKVFPELSEENAELFSTGIGFGMMKFLLNDLFPKFQMVSERLIENGWFINNYFLIDIKGDPDESIYSDNFNVEIIRNHIKEIESLAISRFPHRAEYLKLAFLHHNNKDYISSISLMLPQIDGIFRELTEKDLFSKNKKINSNSWLKKMKESEQESLNYFFLSPLSRDEYFGSSFKDALEIKNFFSRNRILHGEDLELNNETKNYKVISLLLYVISNIYDTVNEDKNNPRLKEYYNGMEELKNRLGLK